MVWDRRNRPFWLRCSVAVLIVILAAVIRWQLLGVLGLFVPFLTFYPAVLLAVFYGGFTAGLLAAAVSAALADYFWIEPVGRFAVKNIPDLIGILFFLAVGALISYVVEAAFQAQARANKAVEEQSRLLAERERVQEKLREQRERLKVTLASIGDGVLTTDTVGKVTFINQVAAALTGRTIEEAVGQPVHDIFRIINEKSRAPAENIVERVLKEGSVVALANHTALVTPDGREVPIEDSAAPIKDSKGEVSGVVLVFHDVTEKRRADEALLESEGRLRLFIEHAPASLAMFDRQMRYLSYSRRWASDYNFGDRSLTGISHYDVFPEISEERKQIHRRALAGEVLRAEDDRFERGDGAVQWIRWEVRPWYDAKADVGGIVIFTEDITKRKQAEDALRESKTKLEAALASMTDAVFISDTEGHFVDFNDAFATYYRFENKGQCFKSLAAFPDILDVYMANGQSAPLDMWAVPRALRGETVTNAEYILRRKDTGETWIGSYSFGPMRDKGGAIAGAVVACRDITEQKRMETEIRKSRDELELRIEERTAKMNTFLKKLEQSNQALQDFASIASHDLQEPLRKVGTFANLLQQKCGASLGEQGSSYLDRVLDANKRMQSLLTGLLEYSRVTTRDDPFTQVDLSMILKEVLCDLEVRIKNTGGIVNIGELPTIRADHTQMRQLFQNLIGNALKFHVEGENPVVWVRSVAVDGQVRIMVEDNGIGFEEQYIDRIFAPFQRLHGRSSQYEGTGMGLAICKKIVERHGGTIAAESAPGSGAKFIVHLPAA